MRRLESRLGLLAVASGAAMAVRRNLIRPFPLHVGEDCVAPLDVVRQGARFVHVTDALAFEKAPATSAAEFKARVRMTMRNWTGTWMYPELLDVRRHPGYAFALWSHKLLRWLGAFALLSTLTSGPALFFAAGSPWLGLLAVGAFATLTTLGALGQNILGSGAVFSFLLANLGFLIGVLKGLSGSKVTAYSAAS